jgi:hypothetical protein
MPSAAAHAIERHHRDAATLQLPSRPRPPMEELHPACPQARFPRRDHGAERRRQNVKALLREPSMPVPRETTSTTGERPIGHASTGRARRSRPTRILYSTDEVIDQIELRHQCDSDSRRRVAEAGDADPSGAAETPFNPFRVERLSQDFTLGCSVGSLQDLDLAKVP